MTSLENIQYQNDINPTKLLEILDELNNVKKTKQEMMPILLELGLFIIQNRPYKPINSQQTVGAVENM